MKNESSVHADAAIGNVTGSNSVNVFLGLGLPWMMAAVYWASFGAGHGSWANFKPLLSRSFATRYIR